MNLKKCRVAGVGDLFDGLIVFVDRDGWIFHDNCPLYPIVRVQQGSKLFSEWSVPIQLESLYIAGNRLTDVPDDDDVEFDLTSPWGSFIAEHRHVSPSGVHLVWCNYEDALTVSISQDGKTLYNDVFRGMDADEVYEFLCKRTQDTDYDMDEIVFDLKKRPHRE
jgi:hypothetical protein